MYLKGHGLGKHRLSKKLASHQKKEQETKFGSQHTHFYSRFAGPLHDEASGGNISANLSLGNWWNGVKCISQNGKRLDWWGQLLRLP